MPPADSSELKGSGGKTGVFLTVSGYFFIAILSQFIIRLFVAQIAVVFDC